MPATNAIEAKQAVKGGAVAGLIGGVVITFFMFVLALLQNLDVWTVFKAASAPLYGDAAFEPGLDAGPVLAGTLLHLLVAVGWGILFGVLAYGLSNPMTIVAGALYGVVVWLGMMYVVLPLIGLGDMARSSNVASAIISHVVFGIAVGAGFLPYQHRKSVTRRATPHRPARVPG